MNLCSDSHDEVCYEGRTCPLCAKQKEIDELEKANAILQDENSNLKGTNVDLQERLDRIQSR